MKATTSYITMNIPKLIIKDQNITIMKWISRMEEEQMVKEMYPMKVVGMVGFLLGFLEFTLYVHAISNVYVLE